ncbi:MAG: hypothetical protein KH315_14160, partial [Faecalibacterium prausnitzii]|nr:hypothetical protein [Faecalibacterium prausnitzii]
MLEFLFCRNFSKHIQGWIRTAAALSPKTAQKQPSGLFLAARLATSTRAHQKCSAYESTLGFLFCQIIAKTGWRHSHQPVSFYTFRFFSFRS